MYSLREESCLIRSALSLMNWSRNMSTRSQSPLTVPFVSSTCAATRDQSTPRPLATMAPSSTSSGFERFVSMVFIPSLSSSLSNPRNLPVEFGFESLQSEHFQQSLPMFTPPRARQITVVWLAELTGQRIRALRWSVYKYPSAYLCDAEGSTLSACSWSKSGPGPVPFTRNCCAVRFAIRRRCGHYWRFCSI